MDDTQLANELINFRTIQIDSDYFFYRVKKEHNLSLIPTHKRNNGFQKILEPLDLFHVPFEKRKAIGTNRFSIPGFPCVYLSDTLLTLGLNAV